MAASVLPGQFLNGYSGIPDREWRKASVLFQCLPLLKKRLEELEALMAGPYRTTARQAPRSDTRAE